MKRKITDLSCGTVQSMDEITAQLHHAQKVALDDTANALQSITELEKLTSDTNQPNKGNVLDAKQDLWDAMVQLGIVASNGEGYAKIKEILSNYGLEDLF